jgi:hypothetical protein
MNFYQKSVQDDYTTPVDYLKVINKYIDNNLIINDPFYFNGEVKNEWLKLGRTIIHEDKDFFTTNHEGDIFVSNPPFSILNKIFYNLFRMDKPFALLIPIQKIAQLKTQDILKNKGLQMIICPIYTGFIDGSGNKTRCASQYFVYLCYKMGLPKDLTFE